MVCTFHGKFKYAYVIILNNFVGRGIYEEAAPKSKGLFLQRDIPILEQFRKKNCQQLLELSAKKIVELLIYRKFAMVNIISFFKFMHPYRDTSPPKSNQLLLVIYTPPKKSSEFNFCGYPANRKTHRGKNTTSSAEVVKQVQHIMLAEYCSTPRKW